MRWLGVINLTWENLQIAKHKSIRWDERTLSWFELCDLQIFSLRPVKPCPGVPGIHLMQTVLFLWPRLFCAAPRRHLCTKFADAPRSRSDRGPCACAKTFLGDVAMVKKWRPRTSCTSCSSKKTIGCQMLLRWSLSLSFSLSLSLSLSFSLSLSLSLSLSPRAHLTHNIGSASALLITG